MWTKAASIIALAATALLRHYLPELKIRFVNVVDLFKLIPHGYHPHGRMFPTTQVPTYPAVVQDFGGYRAPSHLPPPPPQAPHHHQPSQRPQRAFQPPSHIHANTGTQIGFHGQRISQRRSGRGQLAQSNPYPQPQMGYLPPSNSFSHPPSQHAPHDTQPQDATEALPKDRLADLLYAGWDLSTDVWSQVFKDDIIHFPHAPNPT